MEEARRFNEANGLRMIVRSHELVRRGWAVGGRKDVITIFSAADYRGTGNDGAVSFCWRARPASCSSARVTFNTSRGSALHLTAAVRLPQAYKVSYVVPDM